MSDALNIGVDIGGTKVKYGVIDEAGNITAKGSIDTLVENGFEDICARMKVAIKNLIEKENIPAEKIKSIGIGIPGVADKNGLVHNATNLYWKKKPLGEVMGKYFPNYSIFVENDATIAAIAELHLGGLKGVENGLLLTLGTGIGGGIIINGKPYIGHHGIGSEVGHVVIGDGNFYNCSCGNNGCFETFCSAQAIGLYMQKLLKEGEKSSVLEKAGDISKVDSKLIFEEYQKGDALSKKVVDRFTGYLSTGIASLINMLDPQIILIGGGFSKSLNLIIDDLNRQIDEKILHQGLGRAKIEKAKLGNDAGIVGAGMLINYK